MGKYYETSASFPYTWDQLARGFWKRYPNPYSAHVLTEDTIFRDIRGDSLYTQRILTKTNRVPKWGQALMKSSIVSIFEESYVNPKEKTITTYTRNIGFNKIMNVVEKVVYSPDPENPNQMVASRAAWIDSQLFGFRRAIEGFGIEKFRKQCHQTALGFNYVLNQLYPSGLEATKIDQDLPASSRLGETTGKIKQTARRAGELAKERAGSMGSVYAASDDQTNES